MDAKELKSLVSEGLFDPSNQLEDSIADIIVDTMVKLNVELTTYNAMGIWGYMMERMYDLAEEAVNNVRQSR
jgi:hypothetical protein